jgi:hypothetical protein
MLFISARLTLVEHHAEKLWLLLLPIFRVFSPLCHLYPEKEVICEKSCQQRHWHWRTPNKRTITEKRGKSNWKSALCLASFSHAAIENLRIESFCRRCEFLPQLWFSEERKKRKENTWWMEEFVVGWEGVNLRLLSLKVESVENGWSLWLIWGESWRWILGRVEVNSREG